MTCLRADAPHDLPYVTPCRLDVPQLPSLVSTRFVWVSITHLCDIPADTDIDNLGPTSCYVTECVQSLVFLSLIKLTHVSSATVLCLLPMEMATRNCCTLPEMGMKQW